MLPSGWVRPGVPYAMPGGGAGEYELFFTAGLDANGVDGNGWVVTRWAVGVGSGGIPVVGLMPGVSPKSPQTLLALCYQLR